MMTPAGAFVLYICCKRAARPRRNAPAKRAPWPSPSTPKGSGAFAQFKASATTYFWMTRNHTRTRTPEAPFTEILIPKENEGMKRPATRKRATATMHAETLRNTSANSLARHIARGLQSARRKSDMFFHISPLT